MSTDLSETLHAVMLREGVEGLAFAFKGGKEFSAAMGVRAMDGAQADDSFELIEDQVATASDMSLPAGRYDRFIFDESLL